jgi:CRP/FNR family cyclic AMP-dependent transcriptional regulator
MTHEELLTNTAFFAATPASALALITQHAVAQQLQRGDVLFNEGDAPDALFVVLSGRVAIAIGNKPLDSRESMLALMESGDLFGELGMLDEGPRSAMARAIEPSSVLRIPYAPVLEQMHAHPALLWGVIKLLANRLRTMDEVLADSVFLDVTGRTAKRYSSSRVVTMNLFCQSLKRNLPEWLVHHANASTRQSRVSSVLVGLSNMIVATKF